MTSAARSADFHKDFEGRWFFRIKDGNGDVMYESDGYDTPEQADKALKSLIHKMREWCAANPKTEPLTLPLASTPDLPWLRKWRD